MSIGVKMVLATIAKFPEFCNDTLGRHKAWRFTKGGEPYFAIEQNESLAGIWIKPGAVKGEILALRHVFRQFGMRADGNFAPNNEPGRNSAVHNFLGSKDLVLLFVENINELQIFLSEISAERR